MLAKSNVLHKNRDFDNVFKNGKSCYNKILGVKIVKNNLNKNRFGVLVSNKVSKKAVIRNKIKRRIKNIIIENKNTLKIGFDFLIITNKAIINIDYKEIKKNIEFCFKKLNIIKTKKQ